MQERPAQDERDPPACAAVCHQLVLQTEALRNDLPEGGEHLRLFLTVERCQRLDAPVPVLAVREPERYQPGVLRLDSQVLLERRIDGVGLLRQKASLTVGLPGALARVDEASQVADGLQEHGPGEIWVELAEVGVERGHRVDDQDHWRLPV